VKKKDSQLSVSVLQNSFKHILSIPAIFLGIPNSMRILCNTSLLNNRRLSFKIQIADVL
jgi:hypothetical protein